MKYDLLLFDADDTLFDFGACEKEAFVETMAQFGIAADDEMVRRYAQLNDQCWKRFERGELKKEELVLLRFALFLEEYGLKGDPFLINERYIEALSGKAILFEGARELLLELDGRARMAIITNGTAVVQKRRFALSGLLPHFERVFISEELGAKKPEYRFFELVEQGLGGLDKKRTLVIGDSITGDMTGAYRYGLDRLWVNLKGKENTAGVPLTATAESFEQLLRFVLADDE